MAPPAVDRTGVMAPFLRLLAPAPGRLEFAARLAVIVCLTTLVTQIYRTPEPALTAYVVFFLNRPDRTTSIILGLALPVVVTLLIGLVFLIANLVLDDPALRVAAMALVSLLLLFLVSASKLRPVGQTFALIIAYALDTLGSIPAGEIATRGLLYAWLFVGIPASVTILVNLLIGPSPRHMVQQALAERMRLAAVLLRGGGDARLAHSLKEGNGELLARLRLAGLEKTAAPQDLAALRQAAEASFALLLTLDFQTRHPEAALAADLRASLAATAEAMAAILAAGGYPRHVTLNHPAAGLAPLAAAAYREIADTLLRFAEPSPLAAPPAPGKSGFLLPDAFTNPDHLRYAVKTTAAAMFCYLLYSLLAWPGIHTCFLTCYIVSLGTAAETVEKLTLRIAGCLMGAVLGLAAMIVLVPSFESVTALLALLFCGTLAAGWLAAGSPRIAYAGFQLAFAFFLCVIQGSGPSFDMVVARDRVIGILLGNLVSYAVFTRIWPVSLKGQLEDQVRGLVRKLGEMLAAADSSTRRGLAATLAAGTASLRENLALIRYEPPAVRPAAPWLALRQQVAGEIAALNAPLLLMAEQDRREAAAMLRRLDGRPAEAGAMNPLGAAAERPMAGLERSLAGMADAAR